jgi:hypothetical protein
MRTRPNATHRNLQFPGKPNDLYRRFRKTFDAITSIENPAIARNEPKDWFVSEPIVETALQESASGEMDSIRFFLGSTGIGKSTMLRHVFEAAHAPLIKDDYLLIPFCFNSRWPAIDVFNPTTAAASRYLSDAQGLAFNAQAFYKSIRADRPDFLELDPALPETATDDERLSAFKRLNLASYELEKLKWFLSQSTLKRVVLIVDDVESLPFDTQATFILDICRAYVHLQSQPARKFTVKCIISCRPSTHSLLQMQPWFSVYSFEREVTIPNAVDLEALFSARFRSALIQLQGTDTARTEDWHKAYDILLRLIRQVSDKYAIPLTHLCNNNVRDALYEFQQLLTNRKWFQRDKVVSPAFAIRETDYAVNEVAVYRALALRNGESYPGRDSVIVNLMHNTPDDSSDLLVTYVIRYFLNHTNSGNPSDGSQIAKATLCNELVMLFPEIAGPAVIEDCIQYMLGARLVDVECVKGEDILILTPRAHTLWRMLQSNSICLEFFRDDTYQDATPVTPLSPVDYHHPDQTFPDVISFLTEIENSERRRVLNAIKWNLLPTYVARFGEQTLCRYLIGGVRHSLAHFYFKTSIPKKVDGALLIVEHDVEDLEGIIDRAKGGTSGGAGGTDGFI